MLVSPALRVSYAWDGNPASGGSQREAFSQGLLRGRGFSMGRSVGVVASLVRPSGRELQD